MNREQFRSALKESGVVLPYGYDPTDQLIAPESGITEEVWRKYRWNPPHYSDRPRPDGAAGWKPRYAQLLAWALIVEKRQTLGDLLVWTRLQICLHVYMAHDLIDELQNHEQGNYTDEQNTKRDAVRTVYRAQRDLINAATLANIDTIYEQAMTAVNDAIG